MKNKSVKSFSEWYEDEEFNPKKPKVYNKRIEIRKEQALRRGDVEAYLDEDEWDS